jgi:hypothetical protein
MESTAATAESATPTTTTATMAATATVASAAAAAACQLHVAGRAVFPVEEVEGRKTHVRHFLLAEHEALIGRSVQSLRNVNGRKSGGGCASRQRKR